MPSYAPNPSAVLARAANLGDAGRAVCKKANHRANFTNRPLARGPDRAGREIE